MFAVIRTGGKQYRVTPDDVIRVEKLAGDAGSKLELSDVLMIGGDGDPQVGSPLLDKAAVFVEIVEQTRGDKIIVFKKKRRQNYRRKTGHRQDITVLRIIDISADGSKSKAAAKPKTSRAKIAKKEPKSAVVPAEESKE